MSWFKEIRQQVDNVVAFALRARSGASVAVFQVKQENGFVVLTIDKFGTVGLWSPSTGNRLVGLSAYEIVTGEDAVRSGDWVSGTGIEVRGKNGMASMKIYGRKSTAGAPTAGTWPTGAAIMDSNGDWFYCTGGGSPGTWI